MKKIAIQKDQNGKITDILECVEISTEQEYDRYLQLAKNGKSSIEKSQYTLEQFIVCYTYVKSEYLSQQIEIAEEQRFMELDNKVLKGEISVIQALSSFDVLLDTYNKIYRGK